MIQLMKFRDGIVEFAGRYEIYVMAAFRFVVGYVAFRLIIGNMGYMDMLSDYPIPLILALVCCFLPSGVLVFAAAVVILLELYALSLLVCLIVALIFLIMACAYMRFTTRKGMYAVLTPILSVLGIPYVMPVAAGLLGEPYAVISVICGDVTYFILKHITANAVLFLAGGDIDTSALITLAVTDLLADMEMYLYLIGFAAAAVVTFCLRKLRTDASHLIAAAVGIIVQFAVIGGGEMIVLGHTQTAIVRIFLGCVVSFLILMIMSFFTHRLNYARVENVQFEDDDYYYYVKAIPKSFGQKKPGDSSSGRTYADKREKDAKAAASVRTGAARSEPRLSPEEEAAAAAARATHRKSRKRTESELQTEAAAQQLAVDAMSQAAAAQAAEQAAVDAVAERAAAAAQAIYAAAGQAGFTPGQEESFDFGASSFEDKLLKEAEMRGENPGGNTQ